MAVKYRPVFYYFNGIRGIQYGTEKYYVCDRCGKEFDAPNGKTKYCPECRDIVKREKANARKRQYRKRQAEKKNTTEA